MPVEFQKASQFLCLCAGFMLIFIQCILVKMMMSMELEGGEGLIFLSFYGYSC